MSHQLLLQIGLVLAVSLLASLLGVAAYALCRWLERKAPRSPGLMLLGSIAVTWLLIA